MSDVISRYAALMILGIGAACLPSYGNDEGLRARLDSEAPRAWKKYAALANDINIECTETMINPDGRTRMKIGFEDTISGENMLRITRSIKPPTAGRDVEGAEQVECCNSKYSFHLKRSSANQAWLVTHLDRNVAAARRQLDRSAGVMVRTPFLVFHQYLPDWIRDPGFVVTSVQSLAEGMHDLVEVCFETSKSTSDRPSNWLKSGRIWLAPDRLWAVAKCEINVVTPPGNEEIWSQVTEFAPSTSELPLVLRKKSDFATAKGNASMSADFAKFELRATPASAFTLAAFGLPEIDQSQSAPRFFTWMLLALIGILLVTFGYYLRKRRTA